MDFITKPKVYVVGRQTVVVPVIERFLDEEGIEPESFETLYSDEACGQGEILAETAGRLCYMSYGKGRKTNEVYLGNIIGRKHGSVLEHAVWSFIFTGISRSLTHELVRHRAGWGYSQLSQRYVDESDTAFVVPPAIQDASDMVRASWQSQMKDALNVYINLVSDFQEGGMKRKQAREAARSVLPNATETKLFATANARALRHFVELRGSEGADREIRALALQVLEVMKLEAPSLFGDFEVKDGVVSTPNSKV